MAGSTYTWDDFTKAWGDYQTAAQQFGSGSKLTGADRTSFLQTQQPAYQSAWTNLQNVANGLGADVPYQTKARNVLSWAPQYNQDFLWGQDANKNNAYANLALGQLNDYITGTGIDDTTLGNRLSAGYAATYGRANTQAPNSNIGTWMTNYVNAQNALNLAQKNYDSAMARAGQRGERSPGAMSAMQQSLTQAQNTFNNAKSVYDANVAPTLGGWDGWRSLTGISDTAAQMQMTPEQYAQFQTQRQTTQDAYAQNRDQTREATRQSAWDEKKAAQAEFEQIVQQQPQLGQGYTNAQYQQWQQDFAAWKQRFDAADARNKAASTGLQNWTQTADTAIAGLAQPKTLSMQDYFNTNVAPGLIAAQPAASGLINTTAYDNYQSSEDPNNPTALIATPDNQILAADAAPDAAAQFHTEAADYLSRYPDVQAYWDANQVDGRVNGMTLDEMARYHYDHYGVNEQRTWGVTTPPDDGGDDTTPGSGSGSGGETPTAGQTGAGGTPTADTPPITGTTTTSGTTTPQGLLNLNAQEGLVGIPTQSVSDRTNELASADSALNQAARGRALEAMQSRGLINSSISQQAAEAAVLQQAQSLAQSDAEMAQSSNQFNANWLNDLNKLNTQFDMTMKQLQATWAHDDATLAATQNFTAAQNALQRELQTTLQEMQTAGQTEQANLTNKINALTAANQLMISTAQYIADITANDKMDDAAKTALINNQIDAALMALQGYSAIYGSDLADLLDFESLRPNGLVAAANNGSGSGGDTTDTSGNTPDSGGNTPDSGGA